MVEAPAQSVNNYLIEGLSFKLGAGASYVTNRRSVSFFPSGSDTYSPASGVKVIKINPMIDKGRTLLFISDIESFLNA